MTVKELIAMCDIEKLLGYIAELEEYPSFEAAAARYLPVLQELEIITPFAGKRQFVLGMQAEDGLTVMCFIVSEVRREFETDSVLRWLTEADLQQSGERLDWAAEAPIPQGYSFYLISWPEVLAMEVPEENVQEIGAELMAAHILTDMTDTGFTWEEAKLHRATVLGLVSTVKDGNLEDILEDAVARASNYTPTEEQLLAQKRVQALNNLRTYHLLKKYSHLWYD